MEVLDYVPDITDDPKAIEMITELIDKLPDIEVRGSLEKWQASIIATQIDQFSYDYDTYQYRDTVEDREAQELLDKLSAYKPLAKVEELEESNNNMIDNVLNNDSSKKEEKREPGRISVKEKLAEKKAVIEQRDKGSKTMLEKDTEKKNQREI